MGGQLEKSLGVHTSKKRLFYFVDSDTLFSDSLESANVVIYWSLDRVLIVKEKNLANQIKP